MRARVGNLLQGRSITSSSVAFNGVAEKVHLTVTLFDKMKQRCRKNLFAVLSVLLKFLTNLLKAMNDRHIFTRMNSRTLEMSWEKFALHLMKMDLDNRILVDYRHRRWTVNGVTTPSVSTALKTIRCMFVLPHGDRSRLQLPFSWEKQKLLTCDLLHDVIFFKSWRFEIFVAENTASPNQGEFVACPECEDTFSPPSFRINMGTRLYLIKAIRLVVPTDGRPEQSAEWSVFVSWLHRRSKTFTWVNNPDSLCLLKLSS